MGGASFAPRRRRSRGSTSTGPGTWRREAEHVEAGARGVVAQEVAGVASVHARPEHAAARLRDLHGSAPVALVVRVLVRVRGRAGDERRQVHHHVAARGSSGASCAPSMNV
jgi:hypothetical protein